MTFMRDIPEVVGTTRSHVARVSWMKVGILLLVIAGCLPAVVFRYLPMTDLPQHYSVVSVLLHPHDPAIAEYLAPDLGKTLYLAPYLAAVVLAKLVSVTFAMHALAAATLLAYPLGLFLLLRALGRPAILTLLGLPLIYNRAVLWGFVNFQLSMGLSLCGMAVLIAAPTRKRTITLVAISALLVFTHTHGLALLIVFGLLYAACTRSWAAFRALYPLAPAVAGTAIWIALAHAAAGYGEVVSPLFSDRLNDLAQSVFGAYEDGSELWIFLGFAGLVSLLTTGRRLSAPPETALLALAALNLALYFVVPEHTTTAKFIHFRHAVMAAMLIPALASVHGPALLVKRALLPAMVTASFGHAWIHWYAFDREARGFDDVLAALPTAPRLLSLVFDPHGNVFHTAPYVHFAAYAQAARGGDVSTSFAKFWNVPIARVAPPLALPPDFEWTPGRYDDRTAGAYFSHALVRLPYAVIPPSAQFPFELVVASGPWQLYRRAEMEGAP